MGGIFMRDTFGKSTFTPGILVVDSFWRKGSNSEFDWILLGSVSNDWIATSASFGDVSGIV